MPQVIEHAEEKHVVEETEPLRREFLHVDDGVFEPRFTQTSHRQEFLILDAIDRHDVRAAPLALEAVPSRSRADIEHAFAAQIFGKRIAVEAGAKLGDGNDARNHRAIVQFEAVIGRAARECLGLETDQALEFGVTRGGIDGHGNEHTSPRY